MNFARVGEKLINLDLVTHATLGDNVVTVFFANAINAARMGGMQPGSSTENLRFEGKEAALLKSILLRHTEEPTMEIESS